MTFHSPHLPKRINGSTTYLGRIGQLLEDSMGNFNTPANQIFGTVGTGLNSDTKQIAVKNTGTHNAAVTAEMADDESGFYTEVLWLYY
ncbi:MAG: hypothetical protein SVJ22_10535 [Halobacteriota archaeon]|nr:hypothetical protein [Halobacteriota archaeon]